MSEQHGEPTVARQGSGNPDGGGQATEDLLAPLPADSARQWAVLQTRARCEKKLAAWCGARGITWFLPLRTRVHQYGARERRFSSPLFPGYVFAVVDAEAFRLALQQREVARVLRPEDPSRLLHQLRQVRDALDTVELPEVFPFLQEGRQVRVTAGRLCGLEGVVQRWEGSTRIFLNVEMIGQAVALEVDPNLLDPVD